MRIVGHHINVDMIKDLIHKPLAARHASMGTLFIKVNPRNANYARATAPIFACWRNFIETIEIIWDKNSSPLAKLEPTTPITCRIS